MNHKPHSASTPNLSDVLLPLKKNKSPLHFTFTISAMTVRAGGNVLVPCYSSGVIYDLLECLYQFMDSANLGSTPFYFISPVANSSLEFSQIFSEWYVAFSSYSIQTWSHRPDDKIERYEMFHRIQLILLILFSQEMFCPTFASFAFWLMYM